ncbi:VTT domain-containing protein [Candidatus Nomurabacteria bacterium]|nr:VTT domain-containing protein [Candidatus Nomurabacteria bacterium]
MSLIELLLTYKYLILIPFSLIEGPILMIISGPLIMLGILNPLLVYVIIVLGDIVGDFAQYYIGYCGKRFLPYFKITEEKLEKAKAYFSENHSQAIVVSKLVYGIGFTGLVAAGALHIPFGRYFKTCGLVSLVQYAVWFVIGIFFGNMYLVIEKYLNYYAAIVSVIILAILLFAFIRKYMKSAKKGENYF